MSSHDNIDIQNTIDEGKRLTNLIKDYTKLELIDKGSSLLSTLIIIIVIIAIVAIAIFCFCMALYHFLLAKTGDPCLSYSIIGIALLFLCSIIILLRKPLIENPLIKYLSNVLFKRNH